MTIDANTIAELRRQRDDPVYFVKKHFQVEPDAWQCEFLQAYGSPVAKKRISLQACAGPGKTAALAWAGWHFLSTRGTAKEHPKGAAVSTTSDNLKDNLWPEFSKWQNRSQFLMKAFLWTKERIFSRQHPQTWWISARSWSKNANEDEQGRTLSGLHSQFVLALVDESGDIPITILKTAEQMLGNCTWGRIVQAGNPTSLQGMLYAAATILKEMWQIIRITGDPDDVNRSPRIDIELAREQIKTWGRDNPWVMSYILGLFPPSSLNVLLGPDEVREAMNRHVSEDAYIYSQKRIGVDVARFGDDRTILYPRQGLVAFKPAEMRGSRSNEVAARLMLAKSKWGSEVELVDDTGGWGSGVIDSCIQSGVTPIPINFSGKAIDPRYLNKRAEMWFLMAQWVQRGGCLPQSDTLVKELTAPTYMFVNGKFQIEPKDSIKKRLKFSPDEADALALTFALPEMPQSILHAVGRPSGKVHERGEPGVMASDYDPYDPKRMEQ